MKKYIKKNSNNSWKLYYIILSIIINAVKRVIVINRIQNKSFCLCNIYVCVLCIFIMYI